MRTIWPSRIRPGMLKCEREDAQAVDNLPPLMRALFENGEINLKQALKLQKRSAAEAKKEMKKKSEDARTYKEGRAERLSLQMPKFHKSWLMLANNDFNELKRRWKDRTRIIFNEHEHRFGIWKRGWNEEEYVVYDDEEDELHYMEEADTENPYSYFQNPYENEIDRAVEEWVAEKFTSERTDDLFSRDPVGALVYFDSLMCRLTENKFARHHSYELPEWCEKHRFWSKRSSVSGIYPAEDFPLTDECSHAMCFDALISGKYADVVKQGLIALVKEMNEMSGASKKKLIKAGKWVVGALESLCGEWHGLGGTIQYSVEDSSSMRRKIAALIELDVVFGRTEKAGSSTKKRKKRNDSKKTSSSSSSSRSSKSGVKKKRNKRARVSV
eukprot:g5988.t1